MTTADIKRLALILAVQAEIEGMKISNTYYEDRHFQEKAAQLRNLAYCHDDEL